MATTIDNYKIKIDVEGAEKIKAAGEGIRGLATAILGAGVIAFTRAVFQLADSINDLSKATGLSIASIAKLQGALQQAGGSADNAGKMIATFFNKIDDAVSGVEAAQQSLGKLGITFNDLQTLSEQALFDKAISGLAQMEAGSRRTALGMAVFGKSFKDIDPRELEEILATGDFTKLQEAAERMAAMNDRLERTFRNLQLAGIEALDKLVTLFEPIIGKVTDVNDEMEQARKIIEAVGVALGIAFGLQAASMIITLTTEIIAMTKALQAAGIAGAGAGKGMAKAFGVLALGAELFYTSDEEMKILKDAENKRKGINPPGTSTAGAGRGSINPALVTPSAGPVREVSLYTETELRARAQALSTAKSTTDELQKQNIAAQKYLKTVIDTVGMDKNRAADIIRNADLEKQANDKILNLEKQISEEKSKGYVVMGQLKGVNEGVITQYKAQIVEVKQNLEITKQLKQIESDKLKLIQEQRMAMARNIEYMQTMASIEGEIAKAKMQSVVIYGVGTEEQKKMTVDFMGLQTEAAIKIATLKKKLENETNESERKDLQTRIKFEEDYYKKRGELLELQHQNEKAMRESSIAGSKAAFEQISRSMDPYMIAQQKTNQLWSNMSSAIDNFVDNGKFSFSDFAESVIKDLIKIEMKAAAMNLWKIMSGAGGGGGGGGGGGFDLGSLVQTGLSFLGFASGGSPPLDRPSIVGEKGPELFIPRTAGTIVPNNAMGGTPVQNTYVTNNISAIDGASIARLFTQNRQLLLGTIEQAKKELPMSLVRGR